MVETNKHKTLFLKQKMGAERGESYPSSRAHQMKYGNQHKRRDTLITFLIIFLCVAILSVFFYFVFRPLEPICLITTFNVVSTLNQTSSNNNATCNNCNPAIKIPFTVGCINPSNYGITYSDAKIKISVFVDKNTTRQIGSSTMTDFYGPESDMRGNSGVLQSSTIETY